MVRQAIISKHIVLTTKSHSNRPVYGIILIEDELIYEVVIIENNIPVNAVMEKYSDWNPENYSDSYISPGIIDMNVRLEWETYIELTKAAISGGVTFVLAESGYYNDAMPSGEMYCDVGKMATLEISTMESIPYLSDQGYLAVKGYLFPPHSSVQCIPTNLLPVLQEIEKTSLTFIIDPNLPNPRMLYSVSPFRLRDLNDRLRQDIVETQPPSSGAFPDLIEDDEEDEDSPMPKLKSRKSVFISVSRKPANGKKEERSNSDDGFQKTEARRTTELVLNIDEIKEVNEDFANLISRNGRRHHTQTIFDDLDKRIKKDQMTIQNISLAEIQTYKQSGVTRFESPAGLQPNPMTFPNSPMSDVSSASGSIPSSPKPSLLQRRKAGGSLSLLVKPATAQKESLYCYHMANYSHTWEQSGISKIIEALKKSNCRVHISGISAASSINKIRQARESNFKITCEIPASHLIFSSLSISQNDTRFKNFPPIRNQSNTNFLWDLLKMKGIDSITSAHSCIHPDYKLTEGIFQRAANGMPTVGFSLQSVWTTLNAPVSTHSQLEHYIVRLAKWLSLYPAEILNISGSRGSISKGKFADLIVWSPYEKYIVEQEYSPFPQTSPFLGMELFGKIQKVYLRGNLAYNQGKFKPRGRLVMRINP